uniref:Chromo domain-containing protein n=1 Tax=Strongyloides papillosus TaxID=174720 RepID=A0A0N5CBY9_STREA
MGNKNRKSASTTETEYVVEKIIDIKITAGKTMYKVKWEGYSMNECTWEPESNLVSVMHIRGPSTLIKDYNESITSEKKSGARKRMDDDKNETEVPKKKAKIDLESKDIPEETPKARMSGVVRRSLLSSNGMSSERRTKESKGLDKTPRSSSRRSSLKSGNNSKLSEKKSSTSRSSKVPKDKKVKSKPESEEEEYVVEKIVGHRINNRVKEYRVRWEGYSQKDDTWQTIDTFIEHDCLDKYEAELNDIERSAYSGLLGKLLKEVRSGKKCKPDDIADVICQFKDAYDIQYYLVLLKDRDIAFVETHEIPSKFKKACSMIKDRVLKV